MPDNTLDELGFGILRDAFADVFFPGTNTIMTRTRYLVFVPALCLVVEKEKLVQQRCTQEGSLNLKTDSASHCAQRNRLA